MTEEQLSALLRLKRYEQPPAHYFDRLLQDVHRRQRADLLKLPLWKIALERVQTFFSEHSMSRLSYAGALASVMVVGMTAIGLMTPGGSIQRNDLAMEGSFPPIASHDRLINSESATDRLINLEGSSKPALATESQSIRPAVPAFGSAVGPQRYIMDSVPVTVPVSYDVPNSF